VSSLQSSALARCVTLYIHIYMIHVLYIYGYIYIYIYTHTDVEIGETRLTWSKLHIKHLIETQGYLISWF
jgi:hypothetical protein